MRDRIALHEQIDEVNYFLREWQRLALSDDPIATILQQPEIRFVSHAIERVIQEAKIQDIPLVLKTGDEPILARQDRRPPRPMHKPAFTWLIPSSSTICLTDYRRFAGTDGKGVSYVGNQKGLMSLKSLAKTVASGGELRLAGLPAGEWGRNG